MICLDGQNSCIKIEEGDKMRRKNMGIFVKKITAGVLAIAMVVTGFAIIPKTAEAAYAYDDNVLYVAYENSAFKDLYNADKTAPAKTGYVFGGWYSNTDEVYTALNATGAAAATGEVYAKFVPAYVLSVKSQNEKNIAGKTSGSTRILTSVDSTDYQATGIELYLSNGDVAFSGVEENTKVYENLRLGTEKTDPMLKAKDVFGDQSKYFSVWRLNKISSAMFDEIMYIKPYWITMDGTKVYGLTKYVRVQDQINDYISVPVNLMSGNKVAAGVVTMTYPSDTLEFVDCENGRVFKDEMEYNPSTSGTVKVVGNNATVNTYTEGECLYANVRFKIKDKSALYNGDGTRNTWFNFTFTEDFSDWEEKAQPAGVWDAQQ